MPRTPKLFTFPSLHRKYIFTIKPTLQVRTPQCTAFGLRTSDWTVEGESLPSLVSSAPRAWCFLSSDVVSTYSRDMSLQMQATQSAVNSWSPCNNSMVPKGATCCKLGNFLQEKSSTSCLAIGEGRLLTCGCPHPRSLAIPPLGPECLRWSYSETPHAYPISWELNSPPFCLTHVPFLRETPL